ncbi:MAG: hypothetical protein IPN91_11210 [Holophagaceae bacterium]|uniref:Uncharacterized protein n=1 Tax=Candidatus Geothrix odensensis TaxID=2954440 RepID=A0A936F337_9BACT|nr:hypothetical protein [Candidatus Geothrix odensensis]
MREGLALLTNGRGGMARLHADLGAIASSNDCLLGRTCTPRPSDRHVLAKRADTDLPVGLSVRITVRLDLEDRSFHGETRLDAATENHFLTHTKALPDHPGFRFEPAPDRHLEAWVEAGPTTRSLRGLPGHPPSMEGTRGCRTRGDAWSPGWFGPALPRSTRPAAGFRWSVPDGIGPARSALDPSKP